ncbi:hypothetical protein NUU61_002513 [Penicillium alfredii]|uniref:Proteinase inhibitor, propeptide n=1 Tax=Penicillium alfredii TaxID=1506179 RepID=A0A9W9KGP4_9EURO|nr:uncharacterized protein NUU61_002513 [Penicillium alfredii]KAJ5105166.1 hypothetical protein NUU61_002513 [Penicillium alfredii]
MKLFLTIVDLLPLALAAKDLKSVIITYPQGTPDSVMDQAKESLKASGGVITHEYNLIKGFAAEAPAKALDIVSTQSDDHKPNIEEDQTVTINRDSVGEEHSF